MNGAGDAWPPIEAVAFDLDGTLIDTAPDIAVALNEALASQGLPPAALTEARTWIGDGPDMLIQRALDHLGVEATAALRAALRLGFDQATLQAPMAHGRVFPGIEPLLSAWCGRLPMVVVTNKPTVLSQRVVDAAGIGRYFDAVLGADHPEQRKPAPHLLQAAAASLGVRTGALLMVGDSTNDLRCARAAGCPAAWVAWGYGAYSPPEGLAVARVDSPAELGAAIRIQP